MTMTKRRKNPTPISSVCRAIARALRPDRRVSVDTWAEENRTLPPDTPEPGPYRNARTPYLIDIQRTMSPGSPWREGWWMKPHQVGGSVSGENMIGAWICSAAGSMLVVFSDLDAARQWELSRFEPMRVSTRALRRRIKAADRKGSNNTKLRKRYAGGVMRLIGANRAAGGKSATIRYVKFEEPDEYPRNVQGQGSFIKLIINRTSNFGRRAKIFGDGTGTVAGASNIEDQVLRGDQRKWHLHCPDCRHPQVLQWENLKYQDGDPASARYACSECGSLNDEAAWKRDNYRPRPPGMSEAEAQASGRSYWQATATGEPGVASWCDFSALNAPIGWRPWPELVLAWLEAQKALQAGDEGPLITFTNNMLGRCWNPKVKASIGADTLRNRAEAYELMTAPQGVLVVTGGVDVQDNRLAVVLRGWGRGEESWGIWHGEIPGDPSLPEVWRKLAALLDTPIRHASGQLIRVDAVAIDSGHHTEDVYAFCRDAQLRGKHWFAVKGATPLDAPKLGRPKVQEFTWRGQAVPGGVVLRLVGTQAIKTLIDGRLKLPGRGGGGYYHFPVGFEPDYYKQLRAENRVWERDKRGNKLLVWKKGSQANEAFDCEVYDYAAFLYAMAGQHAETVWRNRERLYGAARQVDLFDGAPPAPTPAPVHEPINEPPRSAPPAPAPEPEDPDMTPMPAPAPLPVPPPRTLKPTRGRPLPRPRRNSFALNW
jgi:phage terminase large subunit GpA-like protein